MLLISNPKVREQISLSLNLLPALAPEFSQNQTSLEHIDAFCQILMVENRRSVTKKIRGKLDYELSISYYGALLAGLMSLEVESKNPPVLDVAWLNANGIPDPNSIFSSLLGNITNNILGIIYLVETGLGSQARINLRILLELSWLALALLAKRDLMFVYAQERSDDEERKIYHQHFSARKLQQIIAEIETNTGFPDDGKTILSNLRSELYGMYSKQVHNSYINVAFGAKAFLFEKENQIGLNLFGRADMASYPTLYHMNDTLFYFPIRVEYPAACRASSSFSLAC